MSLEEAQRRIDGWTDGPLDLSGLKLSSVPDSIGNLTNLTELRLYRNQLSSLPDSIGNLTNLTRLWLSGNQLSSLPESIGNLTNLTELWLEGNELSSVPDNIGNLTNLTELRLDGNQLSSLPDSIGNLTNLTRLWLSGNQLSSLPDSIGNLTNLTELRLYENQLSSLPDNIGNLTNLTELRLYENQLSSLPDSIGNLTNLTGLRLYRNQLSSLPVSMTQLGAFMSVDMTEQPIFAPEGSLLLGGNRWSDEFRQAADEGIEALWEHLKNEDPEDSVNVEGSSATSVAELVPDVPVPLELDEPYSPEGRELVGQYEKLLGQVDSALADGVWEDDPITETNVQSNRENLRQNLYESPGAVDLVLTGALAKNLGRQLVQAIVPESEVKDLADSLLAVADPEDPVAQVQTPADLLAQAAEQGGMVPSGRNRFEWVVEALGWTVQHPAVTAAGTFTTIGTTAAQSAGLLPVAASTVGIIYGLIAGTLAYAGLIRRRRNQAAQSQVGQ